MPPTAPNSVQHFREATQAILEVEHCDLPPQIRREIYARAERLTRDGGADNPGGLDEGLRRFVDKVALHAYKVTDEDVDSLLEAGLSEDAVFEAVIAAAMAAGRARLEIGLAALDGKEQS